MKLQKSERGFFFLMHEAYGVLKETRRLLSESSAIDFKLDDLESVKAGSSYLWVDEHFHLDRAEAELLRNAITHWLDKGTLEGFL